MAARCGFTCTCCCCLRCFWAPGDGDVGEASREKVMNVAPAKCAPAAAVADDDAALLGLSFSVGRCGCCCCCCGGGGGGGSGGTTATKPPVAPPSTAMMRFFAFVL